MMPLADEPLPPGAGTQLGKWQAEIDRLPTYADRVTAAEKKFKSRNKRTNTTFKAVRTTLEGMCFGQCRCCYCEDSLADEVEHIAPKQIYPERVFDWSNYLYACGPCNGPKNAAYAVFDASGTPTDVNRAKGAAVVPPMAGPPLLIDPRREDPAEFFELDLAGPAPTFHYVPRSGIGAAENARAVWTRDTLRLNRPVIAAGRRNVFDSYVARLRTYAQDKVAGRTADELDRSMRSLLRMPFPSVFREMQRQSVQMPALEALFAPIPEARGWRHR